MLNSILNSTGEGIQIGEIVICTAVSLLIGVIIALVYMYKNNYSKNFLITLALLPAIVQSVIMVVNGNLGAGVAVMGAFSLVRFRSAPGTAKEIVSIFFAMAAGLAVGMGYVIYAVLFTVIVSAVMLIYNVLGGKATDNAQRDLRITIPEDVDYTTVFEPVFEQYTKKSHLNKVRTTNLGSLFELQYTVTLNNKLEEKKFIDDLRQRNGNLTIVCNRQLSGESEL